MSLGQMHLEVGGVPYGGWIEAQAMRSMEALAGSFSFTASLTDPASFPFRLGSKVRVMLDAEPILAGYVEAIKIDGTTSDHTVSVSGRSRTADLVDSSLVAAYSAAATEITLKKLIENILAANGHTKIKVLDRAPGIKPFAAGEAPESDVGAKIWEHLERCARARQAILNTTRAGEISIERTGTYPIEDLVLVNSKSEPNACNIKSFSVEYNTVERYNKYTLRAQASIPGLDLGGGGTASTDVTGQAGVAVDSSIRATRVLEINASGTAMSTGTLLDRAKWEANIRRSRSMTYRATVQGWYRNQAQSLFLRPNRLIRVRDDMAGIDAVLLIKEVTYRYSITGGATSDVVCTTKDAYSLDVVRPQKTKRRQKMGVNIAGLTQ